jgi:hypothetical protein
MSNRPEAEDILKQNMELEILEYNLTKQQLQLHEMKKMEKDLNKLIVERLSETYRKEASLVLKEFFGKKKEDLLMSVVKHKACLDDALSKPRMFIDHKTGIMGTYQDYVPLKTKELRS